MLRPTRTVRVTTKEELDAALATADQVVVEGDDELLSYAGNKAAGNPESRVTIAAKNVDPFFVDVIATGRGEGGSNTNPAKSHVLIASLVLLVGLLVSGLVVLAYFRFQLPLPPKADAAASNEASAFWANLPSLLWPLVAIVAIVALFLIARQAIFSGSNVTISWKVTEKVTGRMVITKVRDRTPRTKAA